LVLARRTIVPALLSFRRSHAIIGKMMDTVPTHPQFNETYACTPSDARRARKAVVAFAQTWLRDVDSADFESAIGEALADAIEHGKCSRLTVDCKYARKRLVAQIRQNGVGFNPPRAD
jgi:anti-sigma regulatory factor (Ser/Thr protein kinase)